jgi:hypothetical protein
MPSSFRRPLVSVATAVTGLATLLAFAGPVNAAPMKNPLAAVPSPSAASAPLTAEQALAQARTTGHAVAVTGATTPTDALSGNPDGTLTMSRTMLPVRKLVAGVWKPLDATLAVNSDASISPAITATALRLSGGGGGPLATMYNGSKSLAVSVPMTLPTPTLAGATATYAGVLPGVDLQVTAGAQGDYSDVLVVHDATAAANPALRTLTMATQTNAVSLSTDAAGNITASDPHGQAVFAAPAPIMWDSTTVATPAPATVRDPASGALLDAHTHRALASSAAGPGGAAHTAPVQVATSATAITLTPDQAMLTGTGTAFPVYVDPHWTPVGASKSGWASVSQYFPSTRYWNTTPDPAGDMQVGNSGSMWSHTLINFPIATSTLAGATIHSAELDVTEIASYSCNASTVNVYAPATTLTPANASWASWAGVNLGNVVASATVAHGYNTSCPAAGIGFNVLGAINAAVAANRKTQTFLFAGVNEASDVQSWKEFLASSPTLSITYNHAPNTPTGLSTSPATSCTANPPTIVGDGWVYLYAPVSDRDGGNLGVAYKLWKTSDASQTPLASSNPNTLTYTSGTTAVLVVPQATLKTAAGAAITEFSWHVQVTDGIATSAWSTTCNFNFDPTRTGAPIITAPTASTAVGQPATFSITPPPTGTAPSSYLYQLNGGPSGQVAASSGNATITVTPTRFTNTLTITGLSAGSNIGDSASAVFNSTPAATAADADLTGDGAADLLTVGATNGIPAGLWLAPGKNTGAVVAAATDIGANGNAITSAQGSPTDFTGAQAITGRFTGSGLQDILAYYPTGAHAGGGVILNGNGDGSTLQAQLSGNEHTIRAGLFSDDNGDNPLQLANAGNSAGQSLYPDLIAVNGDTTNGFYLGYYPNRGYIPGYSGVDPLVTTTPTGGPDWNSWVITTAQLPTGTAMFLRNPTTGALYLWENLAHAVDSDTLTYTQYTLADGTTTFWNKNTAVNLQAADINGDGTPDLWATGTGATTTAWLVSGLATSPAITAQTSQALLTSTHTWQLNDTTTGTVATATDTTGTLTATGAGNASWNTGDLFDPDLSLDGINSALTTSGPALATNADFTVSVWAKPTATGGVVLSQNGTNTAGFKLWAEPSDSSWRFALPTSDTASPAYNTATAAPGSVHIGIWSQLTATYKQSSGVMHLYLNGVDAASTTHTTTWNATGNFQIGRTRTGASHTNYFSGQVADVHAWTQTIDPTQAATPASYYQPITETRFMDTRTGTGGTTGPIPAEATIKLKIAGANGIPASNVTAVAMNVTVTNPTTGGYIAAYPDNTPRPVTSNLNYTAAVTVANYVIVPLAASGYIDFYNHGAGTAQLVADVSGYFTSDATAAGATSYTALTPTRILDTRSGTGAPTAKLGTGATLALQVAGAGGIPTGIAAVAINLTATNETAGGYLITHADGTSLPGVSGLQYTTAQDIAGLAIVPVAANGKIDIYNASSGATDIVGDVSGYFTTGTAGLKYHAINATRVIDTRQDGGAIAGFTTLHVAQGNAIAAANPTLILNLTATNTAGNGYMTVYPDAAARPSTSNVNWVTGQTVAGLALPVTGNGTIDVYNGSGTTVQLIVDCLGYFAAN